MSQEIKPTEIIIFDDGSRKAQVLKYEIENKVPNAKIKEVIKVDPSDQFNIEKIFSLIKLSEDEKEIFTVWTHFTNTDMANGQEIPSRINTIRSQTRDPKTGMPRFAIYNAFEGMETADVEGRGLSYGILKTAEEEKPTSPEPEG